MHKSLLVFLVLTLSHFTSKAQVKIYTSLGAGFSVVKPKGADIGNIDPSKRFSDNWEILFGVDLNNKWQIETGYISSTNRYSYDYTYFKSAGYVYHALGVYSKVFHGDIFPLRIKKKFIKNKVSLSPSIGLVMLNVRRSNEFNADYAELRSANVLESYYISTSSQELYINEFQTYLEGGITLQTPFIVKPINLFVKGSYAYGLSKISETQINYNIEDINIDGEFNTTNRLSYLNFSIGLLYTLKEFKKNE